MLLVIYFHPTHALDRHKLVPPTMHISFPRQMWCMPCLFRMLIPLLLSTQKIVRNVIVILCI